MLSKYDEENKNLTADFKEKEIYEAVEKYKASGSDGFPVEK
jgi:hypothetical protein